MTETAATFITVTEREFFAALRADPRDIMPRNHLPDSTDWEVRGSRAVWGRTTPGWRNPNAPKTYALRSEV